MKHLSAAPNANQYLLTDSLGNRSYFNDFSSNWSAVLQGKLASTIDANGNSTTYTYNSTTGQLQSVARTSGGSTETFAYTYNGSGQLTLATLSRTGYGVVRQAAYSYWDGTTLGGAKGDLRKVTIEDGSGNPIDVKFFRYYNSGAGDGATGFLSYVFGPDAYARALANGIDPATDNTDSDLQRFADEHIVYNTAYNDAGDNANWGKVKSETLAGAGTYTFTYGSATSTSGGGYDVWVSKATETLPDGSTSLVYSNMAGEPVFKLFTDASTSLQYPTFYKYDSVGRLLWTAHPSAFVKSGGVYYSESYPDLINDASGASPYLSQSAGLIEGTDYYATTTATSSTPGGVAGYDQDTYVRHGEAGTKVLQEAKDYISQTADSSHGGATIYEVADDTVYGTAGSGDPRVTRYTYSFATGSTQLLSQTTIAPPITSTQNGPATSTSDTADADQTTQVFDAYGRVVWQKDGGGFLTYNQYDPATGALLKHIDDVNTADSGDFTNLPSGWTTPSGGGLELITTYQVDGLGRTTREQVYESDRVTVASTKYIVYNDTYAGNPNTDLQGIRNEVRVYDGWNSTTNAPTGPIEVTRTYRPLANSYGLVYTETLTSSATPTVLSGVPTGQETLDQTNIQSLSRTLTNDAGQVTEVDVYSSLSGLTYSSAAYHVSGAVAGSSTGAGNYSATSTTYDSEGRPLRVTDPNGTITQDTYDGLGQVTSVSVGTSTANIVDVEDDQYDNGGTGDGNLTQVTRHVGGGNADRVTLNLYDFRDRLIATKAGALITSGSPNPSGETDGAHRLITFYTLDNLGEATGTYLYAGDQVPLTDFANWTDTGTDPGKMRAWTRSAYDDQGRAYQTVAVGIDPANGVSGLTDAQIQALPGLTTNLFFDHRGNTIAESDPGGQVTKHAYDGAGRDAKDSITDGGVLAAAPLDWTHAGSLSSDVVIEQTLNTYDTSGNLIETISRQRFDNDPTTATGDLQGPSGGNWASRDYYSAMYYDLSDRQTDSVNVGTDGGSAWTRPSSVPSPSDAALVTHTDYDPAGKVLDTIDPRGLKTEHLYDMQGNETKTIAAWDGTQNPTPGNAYNQTTTNTYDANGDVLTMTAVMPSGTNSQTTAYVYGVGVNVGTDLFSNDLIAKVEYPDKTTGQASTAASNDQSFAYDFLGDKTSFTDQNGTTHAYLFDVLGRLTADKVTTFGTGVDQTVKRLGFSFDDAGRPFQQTSYTDANGTVVLNQVRDVYNGLGQLITEYQEHAGSVNTGTSKRIQYGYNYMASGANNTRPTSITYPNARVVSYGYNTGLDTTISRVSSLIDSSVHLVDYTYLGLSTIVQQSHPQPNITLTYIQQVSDPNPPPSYAATGGDRYTGLDQFGRVVDQLWMHGSVTSPTDRFQYAYDRDSNALYRKNVVNGNFSELYHANSSSTGDNATAYDSLNRLQNFRRGVLSASGNNGTGVLDTITTATATNNWNLDALGNWNSTGSQTRTFNSQNQITAVSGHTTPAYDNNGNTKTDERGYGFTYDAWNRMTISNGGIGHEDFFTYDADNRRPGISVCSGAVTDSYYSQDWQDLEDVAVTTGGCGGNTTETSTYVWGQSYVDDLVARDDSTYGRQYAQQDANHDVTALVGTTGAVQERFIYDPYGTSTVLSSGWGNSSDLYNWVYRFQGGRYDPVSGLYNFRNRDYSPTLGRWMEQDPLGYVDGANRYLAFVSDPIRNVDPTGTKVPGELSGGWKLVKGPPSPTFPPVVVERIDLDHGPGVHTDYELKIKFDEWELADAFLQSPRIGAGISGSFNVTYGKTVTLQVGTNVQVGSAAVKISFVDSVSVAVSSSLGATLAVNVKGEACHEFLAYAVVEAVKMRTMDIRPRPLGNPIVLDTELSGESPTIGYEKTVNYVVYRR